MLWCFDGSVKISAFKTVEEETLDRLTQVSDDILSQQPGLVDKVIDGVEVAASAVAIAGGSGDEIPTTRFDAIVDAVVSRLENLDVISLPTTSRDGQ